MHIKPKKTHHDIPLYVNIDTRLLIIIRLRQSLKISKYASIYKKSGAAKEIQTVACSLHKI